MEWVEHRAKHENTFTHVGDKCEREYLRAKAKLGNGQKE
jgi:hypothetical protein